MSTPNLWKRYQQYLCGVPALSLTLDVSRMRFEDDFLERTALPLRQAFEAMDDLERGGVASPDEKRMVGHYWLRAPDQAPSPAIAGQIRKTVADVKAFAAAVHDGTIRTTAGLRFTRVLPVTATDSPSEHRTPVADRPRVGARDHGEPEQSGRVFPACCLRGRLPGWGRRQAPPASEAFRP